MATDTSKTQYEQTTNDENLVEEDISPEILKILGLEDVFDFDYGEYKTLLREKLTELDMKASQSEGKAVDKKISEKQSLLIEEFKRVKRSTGRFKVKSQKVKADKFTNKKQAQETKTKPIDSSKLLPPGGVLVKRQPTPDLKPVEKQEEQQPEEKKDDNKDFFKKLLDSLKAIRSVVKSLFETLLKQLGLDKKRAEVQRREGEKKEAKQEEKDLEKKEKDKGSSLLEKVTKPFTSIFDTIRNFLLNVLIGSVITWLLKVLRNPMSLLKPIQGLVDGIVGFFNSVIQFIDNMVVQPVRNFIDMINSALKGFIDILNNALKMLPGSPQFGTPQVPNIPEPPQIQSPDITGEKKQQQQQSGPPINLKFTGGQVSPIKQKDKKQMTFDDKVSREGGTVSSESTSYDVSGLGPDKHLTALSTGEYVLKKGAADYLGGPAYLDGINKMFGGTTERRVASIGDIKVQAANEGGTIGFDPVEYVKNTKQYSQINVGSGASKKRYSVAYSRKGASGTYVIKKINKVVKGAGLGILIGQKDQLTGVKPSSSEGKLVVNSVSLRQYLQKETGKIAGKVKIEVDPQADIYWAYNQAYQTHYNKWKSQPGITEEQAKSYAARAATEFALSRKSASWMPGSKEGLDTSLKQVEVAGAPTSSTSDSSTATKDEKPTASALNFAVLGDPSTKSPRLNSESKSSPSPSQTSQSSQKSSAASFVSPQSSKTKSELNVKNENGDLSVSVLGPKNNLEKTSSIDKSSGISPPSSPASIVSSNKPKQSIPQPPSNKPTITALPIPGKSKVPTNTGMSNHGSNNLPVFSSYREEEPTLAVVASIYNMWGGL